MPLTLPQVSLTGAVVGTTGVIDMSRTGYTADPRPYVTQEYAHIFIMNDSGCGLQLTFQPTGRPEVLPAGRWCTFPVYPGENSINFVVIYVLPNQPISTLLAVYYYPHEGTPVIGSLGNSPIGISGAIQVSSVNTLSNEGSASGLLVIDAGDSAFNQIFTFFNDGHATWAVDQAGVKHQVIKVQASGNPLLLGQSGDTVEVLGTLQADVPIKGKDSAGNVYQIAGYDASIAKQLDIADTTAGILARVLSNMKVNGTLEAVSQLTADNTFLTNNPPFLASGSVSGSWNLYAPITGSSLKIYLSIFNNWNSNQASFGLPTALTNHAFVFNGGAPQVQFALANVAQNFRVLTSLASGGGTQGGLQTTLSNWSIAEFFGGSGADSIVALNTGGTTFNGILLIIGV